MTFPDWLDEGCAWLAQVQKIGLSMSGRELLDRGRAWQQRGELLGWHQAGRLFQTLAQENAPMSERAGALLDLAAWLTTARRVLEAQALAAALPDQGKNTDHSFSVVAI
ncbi:hypothetical protein INH39_27710 [Massilia violaceinigra]|uniref:Uncharacterized protein n=1 Tax=Massilia violaceinigra TaxID=2045208 RepID=A0ABY4A327_9BURK|nr:hypothetical protein [Massilia violaceinigra]UOD29165.1 hypothetical protein INH39_27710 [Massilia violaceinigra]